ncbi:hypothetical protein BJ917_1531 [Pseudomonas sp. WPR_5_2]|uniref:hypothetical protein n=1 Tax=Pseudomonas sp. WPR_5_2 TaxID=1907371 RepID=UPI000EAC5B56|nr:hypothetical protein [Pseudomonas sp. WPR_5_2]RKS28635.1 hypothetical protein BJ917_1531 [Pseudomonas sp. WPR_5_2]
MPSSLKIANVAEAIQKRLFPSVTIWNRLEGRPRTPSFERALRAEVRDALWMLTKQWQMGEFKGSDAGSPVFAKLQMDTTRLTKYQPDDQPPQLFEYEIPIEAKVERRPFPLMQGERPIALDLRLLMGRQWLALIKGVGAHEAAFIAAYPITPVDPTKKEDADKAAHPEVWQWFAATAGRAMDGAALYAHLQANPANHAYDGIPMSAADETAIDDRAARFLAWFDRQFLQPPASGDDAWEPSLLEYQFSASAPAGDGEKVYRADAYYQGQLDWYSLDVDAKQTSLTAVPGSDVTGLLPDTPRTMIPTPVSFSGMPNTRWWSFEDRKTNFGDISASTTDLAKLLFIEFALVYSNDWFVIPYTLPAGAIATIRGFAVTNVFGERFWILPAGAGTDAAWQRWNMFTINVEGAAGAQADTSLLVLPTVPKIQESAPTEEILLLRDEVANMVWGVEKTVPIATGETKSGLEAARQMRAFFESDLARRLGGSAAPKLAISAAAPIRYQVMNSVPENWIPFIPVHVPGSNREIQLQRAALPRIVDGDPDPPVKVRPRTALMREGLDQSPAQPYFLHEEEVPRAGGRLTQCFARTRWTGGQVYTWLRVRRGTGRGEGSSGLGFDEIVPVPVPPGA